MTATSHSDDSNEPDFATRAREVIQSQDQRKIAETQAELRRILRTFIPGEKVELTLPSKLPNLLDLKHVLKGLQAKGPGVIGKYVSLSSLTLPRFDIAEYERRLLSPVMLPLFQILTRSGAPAKRVLLYHLNQLDDPNVMFGSSAFLQHTLTLLEAFRSTPRTQDFAAFIIADLRPESNAEGYVNGVQETMAKSNTELLRTALDPDHERKSPDEHKAYVDVASDLVGFAAFLVDPLHRNPEAFIFQLAEWEKLSSNPVALERSIISFLTRQSREELRAFSERLSQEMKDLASSPVWTGLLRYADKILKGKSQLSQILQNQIQQAESPARKAVFIDGATPQYHLRTLPSGRKAVRDLQEIYGSPAEMYRAAIRSQNDDFGARLLAILSKDGYLDLQALVVGGDFRLAKVRLPNNLDVAQLKLVLQALKKCGEDLTPADSSVHPADAVVFELNEKGELIHWQQGGSENLPDELIVRGKRRRLKGTEFAQARLSRPSEVFVR